jgi:hypothetical protein
VLQTSARQNCSLRWLNLTNGTRSRDVANEAYECDDGRAALEPGRFQATRFQVKSASCHSVAGGGSAVGVHGCQGPRNRAVESKAEGVSECPPSVCARRIPRFYLKRCHNQGAKKSFLSVAKAQGLESTICSSCRRSCYRLRLLRKATEAAFWSIDLLRAVFDGFNQ